VARIGLADNHDVAIATNHLAVLTDGLDAGIDLHCGSLFRCLRTRGTPRAVTFQPDTRVRIRLLLLVAVDDPTTGQVVWAQLYDDAVLREDADVVLTHLARNVGKNTVAVGQLNAEHRVRQSFDYCALDLDDTVFVGHSLFVTRN
jgi:hypothetical protein